jgi:hypothetical protein
MYSSFIIEYNLLKPCLPAGRYKYKEIRQFCQITRKGIYPLKNGGNLIDWS